MRYTAPRMVLPSRAIPVCKDAGISCCALKINNKHIENKMKKTLIALLALGTAAVASTEMFDAATKTATIALTFDVEALESISDVNFAGDVATKPNFFMFAGSWAGGDAGSLGLANNGSSGNDTSGLWGSWVKGANSGNATDTGLGSIFTASTAWDNISAVSLVYSYSTPDSGATTTNVALSIGYIDGSTTTTYGETKNNVVFNGNSGFASTGVTVNDDYVATYEVSTAFTTLDDAKTKSAALVVPEPTTATLSLLALAGLAARRRRNSVSYSTLGCTSHLKSEV